MAHSQQVGRHVPLAGKHDLKGYVGYMRSVTSSAAHIELEANHNIRMMPLNDVIDL